VAKAMTGLMDGGGYGQESPDHKGSVIIEWSSSTPKQKTPRQVLPGTFTKVLDWETERLIPAASITVHATYKGLITADVAVYLDECGEILHDPAEIAKADTVPATFPFLVAEMRVR
jgi:hypothetical protein